MRNWNYNGEARLTSKQEAFAHAVAQGSPMAVAYRLSYDAARMQPPTVWNAASTLARHPMVSARVEELRSRLEAETYRDAASLRGLVLSTLASIASDEKAKSRDRIRAAELLGQIPAVGLFGAGDCCPTPVPVQVGEIENRIRSYITTRLGNP